MSLSRPCPRPPPADPKRGAPGGKRPRLGEPGWRLPAVRPPSEADRAWVWPSREPPLVLAAGLWGGGAAEATPAPARPRCTQPPPDEEEEVGGAAERAPGSGGAAARGGEEETAGLESRAAGARARERELRAGPERLAAGRGFSGSRESARRSLRRRRVSERRAARGPAGRGCWVVESGEADGERVERSGEKPSLLQLQATDPLGEAEGRSVKAPRVQERLAPLRVQELGSPNMRMNIAWLNSKGENDNVLQISYHTMEKDFHVRNIFQSIITESFHFRKNILRNQRHNRILSWCQILQCKNQIGVNLIRSINVNIKNDILSKYVQTSVSEHLNIFATYIAYMFNNFNSLARIEDDSELEEGYTLKWIVHLNYSKRITVEGYTVYIIRTVSFSKCLEDMKPVLNKRKPIFETQQIFEWSKKENFDSFSATPKNVYFPIFKVCGKIPFLMGFGDMAGLSLIKKSSYKNMSWFEQHMNVDVWVYCNFITVKTHVKSGPQFIQEYHGLISGKCREINMHNQDLGDKRKQAPKKVSTFNSKHTLEGSFSVRQQSTLGNQNTVHSLAVNSMIVNQMLNFESLQNEMERPKHDFILKEVKVTAQSSINSCQVCIKIEKEENRFSPKTGMLSVQLLSRSKKVNMKETKSVNQNNTANKSEYESILQENELANSKHFHPKSDATLYVNQQVETDSNEGNNEHFENLTAKCLSTEALKIAKDFEMKSKFDLVLKELRMFHEISKENETSTIVETNNGQQNYFEESNDKEAKMEIQKHLKLVTADRECVPPLPSDTMVGPHFDRRHQSLFKWKTVPCNGEQEVPSVYCCPRTVEEEILCSIYEQDGKNSFHKDPALFPGEYVEGKFNYLSNRVFRTLNNYQKASLPWFEELHYSISLRPHRATCLEL
ncbi:RAD51-associated protein 2 isoform X2 [Cavia porcellus]|uniref:RAD51-associated protein 2 isoform X2 n=1 Tax=Cavia porcellus TaxID=10141 RepID=UPI002FE3A33D